MPTGIVTKGLAGNNDAWNAMLLSHSDLKELRQVFCRTLAQFAKQLTIIKKESSQNLWDSKNILPMRDWIQYGLFQMVPELHHLFVVT